MESRSCITNVYIDPGQESIPAEKVYCNVAWRLGHRTGEINVRSLPYFDGRYIFQIYSKCIACDHTSLLTKSRHSYDDESYESYDWTFYVRDVPVSANLTVYRLDLLWEMAKKNRHLYCQRLRSLM